MKAEHHLTARPAVHEEQRRARRGAPARNEKLAVNRQAVFGGEGDLLGHDQLRGGKFAGKLGGGEHLASRGSEAIGHGRGGGGRAETHDGAAVSEFGGRPLQGFAFAEGFGLAAIGADAPEVAAVNVVLVRGVNDRAGIARDGDVFDFEIAGSEESAGPAGGRNGVEMVPAILLRGENDAVAGEVEVRLGSEPGSSSVLRQMAWASLVEASAM